MIDFILQAIQFGAFAVIVWGLFQLAINKSVPTIGSSDFQSGDRVRVIPHYGNALLNGTEGQVFLDNGNGLITIVTDNGSLFRVHAEHLEKVN